MQRPDSGKGWIPALVVALGLGTAAGTAIPRQPLASEPNQPAESNRAEATPVQDTSSQESEPPTFLAHLRPVMGLLEEALGVDSNPTEEIRAASSLHQYLCSLRAPSPADSKARSATAMLWESLDAAGYAAHAARSRHVHKWDLTWAAGVLSGYSPEKLPKDGHIDGARKRLVEHFQSLDADKRRLRRLADKQADVQFLIASIADYVDSSSGWYADQQIDAIQSGMAQLDYSLDRFYLPDWNAAGTTQTRKGDRRRHEREPGAVLFRKLDSPWPRFINEETGRLETRNAAESWIVVLLVTETPTYGIHKEAFVNAGQFVAEWKSMAKPGSASSTSTSRASRESVLRVLGPTYSGSIWSLRLALENVAATGEFKKIDIASGSANLDTNKAHLEFAKNVHFRTTVTASSELARALKNYFKRLNDDWADGKGMALLYESNTAFGGGAVSLAGWALTEEAPRGLATEFPNATFISFPLHISRLRQANASGARDQASNWILPKGFIPLKVSDAVVATDHFPAVNAEMAASSVQTAVSSILYTLRRESVSVVGISATDDRDVLYLARELRRALPNVQLFFMSSHILYLYPEFVPYTKGSLVASTYPLFMGIQRWMPNAFGVDRRRQFYSMISEGMSNALGLLLGSDMRIAGSKARIGGPVPNDYHTVNLEPEPRIVERTPERPPIWISVVGRDAFWPLTQVEDATPDSSVRESRFHDRNTTLAIQAQARATSPRTSIKVGFIGLFLFVLWHIIVVCKQVPWRAHVIWHTVAIGVKTLGIHLKYSASIGLLDLSSFIRASSRLEPARAHLRQQRQRELKSINETSQWAKKYWERFEADDLSLRVQDYQRVFTLPMASAASRGAAHLLIFSAFGVLGLLMFWASGLFWLLETGAPPSRTVSVISLVVFTLVPCLLFLKYGAQRETERRGKRASRSELLELVVVTGFIAVSLGYGALAFDFDPLRALLRYERSIALTSLVSPVAPMALLLAVLYLWIRWQLDRISQNAEGYTYLFGNRPTRTPTLCGLLLWGSTSLPELGKLFASTRRRFIAYVDSPLASLRQSFGLGTVIAVIVAAGVVLYLVLKGVHTVEGREFTGFLRATTALALVMMSTALVQTVVLWNQLRGFLIRLGHSSFGPVFKDVSELGLDWRLNLRLPRKDELRLLMRLVDQLNDEMVSRREGLLHLWRNHDGSALMTPERRARGLLARIPTDQNGIRLVKCLDDECAGPRRTLRRAKVALLMSKAFHMAWEVLQQRLESVREWQDTQACPQSLRSEEIVSTTTGSVDLDAWASRWFNSAQTAIALALAFVIRDLLSRVVSGLSIATIGFFLILLSHLLYSFQGRSTLLMLDWAALAATSAIALYIVVQMERNEVLSRLWNSTPGRVTFNRDFVGRVAIYGALPLVTIVSGVFPEIGDTLFSWLAPVRQLVSF